jgi:hypothetical protein
MKEMNRPPSSVRMGGFVEEILGFCWLRKINASELRLGCGVTRHLPYVDISTNISPPIATPHHGKMSFSM